MNADLLVVERLFGALSEMTVKGTVILAIAGLVTTWAMRRAAAATRHLVWSTAVAAVLALPLLRVVAPEWSIPSLPSIGFALPSWMSNAPREIAVPPAAAAAGV